MSGKGLIEKRMEQLNFIMNETFTSEGQYQAQN